MVRSLTLFFIQQERLDLPTYNRCTIGTSSNYYQKRESCRNVHFYRSASCSMIYQLVQKKKRKNGFILSMCKIASMTILSLFIYLIVYTYMLTNMTINSHHGLYVVQWTINPYMYIQCIDSVYQTPQWSLYYRVNTYV